MKKAIVFWGVLFVLLMAVLVSHSFADERMTINRAVAPANDVDGAIFTQLTRLPGVQGVSSVRHDYYVQSGDGTCCDVAATNLMRIDQITNPAYAGFAGWDIVIGPPAANDSTGHGLIGREINVQESAGDQGYLVRRGDGKFSVGLQLVPETGFEGRTGSNCSFALAITHSGGAPYPAWHTGISFEDKSIASGGIGIGMTGGDNSLNDPAAAVKFRGHFGSGIDFTDAAVHESVLKFAQSQIVEWTGGAMLWANSTSGLNVGGSLKVHGNATIGALFLGDNQGLLYDAGPGNIYLRSGTMGAEKYFGFLSNGNIRQASGATPLSSTAPGVPGEINFDDNFLYYRTSAGVWKRAALSPF